MRRVMLSAVLVLVMGAITSLVLAWSFAAWMPVLSGVPRSPIGVFERWGRAWHSVEHHQPGIVIRIWGDLAQNERIDSADSLLKAMNPPSADQLVARYRAENIEMQRTGSTRFPFTICDDVPSWGTFAAVEPDVKYGGGSDSGFGWPRPCMWYQVLTTFNRFQLSTTSDTVRGGVMISGTPSGVVPGFHAIPLRPIWSGLLVDTACFGAAWAVVLFGSGAVRRAIRRRAGRCVSCGYDLRGLLAEGGVGRCPECGKPTDVVA